MIIGTTKELKNHEYRVGITPDNVLGFVADGHTVLVETGAGEGAGFPDAQYVQAGAVIVDTPAEVFAKADMIVKVKEPEACEYDYLRENQILFTYLHLAPNPELAEALISRNVKAVAFETITDKEGNLPCLRPMSQIAGRLSIQEGAKYLEKNFGGRGILLGGVPGVARGKIVIIGGGIAGTFAAKAAVGIDAQVTLLDVNLNRLSYLEDIFGASVTTLYSTEANIRKSLEDADLVIGSVLLPGGKTPKLVRREHLKLMKKGSVIVDIAIDQGGNCAITTPGVKDVKYGVTLEGIKNIPGMLAASSTFMYAANMYNLVKYLCKDGTLKLDMSDDIVSGMMTTMDGKVVHAGALAAMGG